MSEVKTLFRFCPSCGKRFHIELVSKKLVSSERKTFEQTQATGGSASYGSPYGAYGARGSYPVVVEENVPVTVDIEDFQYSYKCKHCGHEWTENRTKQKTE